MTEDEKEKRIKARVAGRKAANEIFEYVALENSWPDGHGSEFADSLCEELRKLLPQAKATEVKPEPLLPIARLGSEVITFGKYAGTQLDGVPLAYLDWLMKENEGFAKRLKAYLTHPELESRRRGL